MIIDYLWVIEGQRPREGDCGPQYQWEVDLEEKTFKDESKAEKRVAELSKDFPWTNWRTNCYIKDTNK